MDKLNQQEIQETIIKLREAIEKDEQAMKAHKEHIEHLGSLQKQETDIKEEISKLELNLKKIQENIVSELDNELDFSDEMTLSAAKETLAKLENQQYGEIN